MSDENNAQSQGQAATQQQQSQQSTSMQQTSRPVPAPAKTNPFAGGDTPSWVKEAGLEEQHAQSEPKQETTVQQQQTVQAQTPTQQTQTQTQSPSVAAAPAAAPFDTKEFAKTLAEALRPQPGQAAPSDADVAKQLGIVTLTPESYKAVFGVDGTPEQVRALNDYGQAIAKQAVTIASVLMTQQIKSLQESLSPYTSAVRQQEAGRQKELFFKENADLTGYEELVTQQYNLALASGKQFATVDEARKYVAEQTRNTLKSLGIAPKVGGVDGSSQTRSGAAPQQRSMAPTSVGGRGGTNTGSAKPKNNHEAVWGAK